MKGMGEREGGKEGKREGGKEGRRERGKEGKRERGKEGRRGKGNHEFFFGFVNTVTIGRINHENDPCRKGRLGRC